jgi:exosome complex RNA-binding protein Rrp42 (RNase PH superfamily)
MDPSAYAALFPRERFERFVVSKSSAEEEEATTTTTTTGGLRLRPGADGRPLGRARRVKIGFAELAHVEDDCGASVMCHLKGFDGKKGKKTTVVCASRMERTGTNPRCPEEGFVEVNVEIASCSHAENSAHNVDRHDRGATIGRVLRETVFSSKNEGLIDRKCLRDVQPGGGGGGGEDKCWKLVVECLVIDDDMGTMDACLAAIVACLRKTRVPDATTTSTKKEDTKRTNDDGTKEKKKERKMLEVNRSFKPVCLTVGAFNLSSHNNDGDTTGNNFNSKKRKMDTEEEKEKDTNKENEEEEEIEDYVPPKQIVVVDPTYEETKLCNALIHVIVDENGNVLGLEQSHDGASEVDETVLAKAIAAAKLRHGEVWKRIEQFDEMKEEEDEDEGE